MKVAKFLISFFFVIVVSYANAALQWSDGKGGLYGSPEPACMANKTSLHKGELRTDAFNIVPISGGRYRVTCSWTSGIGSAFQVYTVGDCPTGASINTTTGVCQCPGDQVLNTATDMCEEPNNCSALAGTESEWNRSGTEGDGFLHVVGGNYLTKSEGCQNGCSATIKADCKVQAKPGASYACRGTAYIRAMPCAGAQDDFEDGDSDPGEPELTNDDSQECSNWVEDAEGRKHRDCTTTSNSYQEGKTDCGTVNGTFTCVTKPTPQSSEKTRTDSQKQSTDSNGNTTTETTSTTNNTYCAAGACNTTSTTTKTTIVTDSNGNKVSESSECKGANCTKPGNGTGTGTGEGEGDGEEGSGMPGSITGPDVSGALPEIGGDDDQSISQSTAAYFDRIADAPIVAAFTSITVPSGGSCNIGNASLFGGSVSFNSFCQLAPEVLSGLRYLFLAIWAWAAIRLFGTA